MTHEERIEQAILKLSDEEVRTELAYLLILQSNKKDNEVKKNLDKLLKKIAFNSVWENK